MSEALKRDYRAGLEVNAFAGGAIRASLIIAVCLAIIGVGAAVGWQSYESIMDFFTWYDKVWTKGGTIFGALVNGLTPGLDFLHHTDKQWGTFGRWTGRAIPVITVLATLYNARGTSMIATKNSK